MLQNRTALAIVLAACGGPAEEPSGGEVSEASAPTTITTEPPAAEPTPEEPVDLVEHLREKTMHLWDVYNTHDPDALHIFYSDSYWEEERESLRENMQPFINQNLTFTAEETSPPTEIAPGKWETKHTARFQGGLVNMVFIYEEFDGTWLLTFAKPQ